MGQNRLILEMIQIENLYVKMEEAVFSFEVRTNTREVPAKPILLLLLDQKSPDRLT